MLPVPPLILMPEVISTNNTRRMLFIEKAKTQGVQVAEGLGYDKEGNETTNPAEIMEGAIKPFDKGFKGAGLALMVQIIGGALVGGDFLNESENDGNVVNIYKLQPNKLEANIDQLYIYSVNPR